MPLLFKIIVTEIIVQSIIYVIIFQLIPQAAFFIFFKKFKHFIGIIFVHIYQLPALVLYLAHENRKFNIVLILFTLDLYC